MMAMLTMTVDTKNMMAKVLLVSVVAVLVVVAVVRLRLLLPPLLPDADANEDEDKGGEEDARRFEA